MKKIFKILIVLIIVLAVVGYFLFYRPYKNIKAKGLILLASGSQLKDAVKKNNIDLLQEKLNDFSSKYKDFEKAAASVYWASFIPYVSDFKNGVEAGNYLIKAANESVKAILPYADLIGFKKGTASFSEKSSEDRLQMAVLTLDKVMDSIDVISEDIKQADLKIQKIEPKRYPEKIGSLNIRPTITNLKEQFNGMASLFVDAKPLLKKLPEIFGNDREKIYLLLFQNDKELRATGGFLTSYALFKVEKGKIRIERSDDIYSLDNSISSHPVAPREILTYHKGVNQFYIRDSNLSPDFPTSVELFNSLYSKSGQKVNYDGIIAMDSKILVDMLTIFGDTDADGVTFSSKIDKRCNCPQVIYQLFDMVDRPVNYVKENRKGILGDLMYTLFYKALGFSPSKYWGRLMEMMFENLQKKHILLYFTDAQMQKSVENLNFGGTIRDYSSDYLHINNVNFAGAKSNMFVSESIESKTKFEGAKITRQVSVEYKNPYPHSDCSLERGGLCLNAILRNWIRVYVPKGSSLVSFKGSEMKVNTYEDLGKTVFEGFLKVNPEGKAQVIVDYTLPSNVSAKDYSLLIQKQPGTDNQKLKVQVDDKTVFQGVLDLDKEIKIK